MVLPVDFEDQVFPNDDLWQAKELDGQPFPG
jgi:hypothetical protein